MDYQAIGRVPSAFCRKVIDMSVPRDDLDVDYIIERYQSGASARELGVELGVSHRTIAARLSKAGVELRGTGAARKASVKLQHIVPDVLSRFDRGDRPTAIAKALCISADGVKSILVDNGRDSDANIPLPLNVGEMVRRYAAGESAVDIAASMGTSASTVKRRLIQAGVTLRSAAEANRLAFECDPARLAQARAAQALGVAVLRRDDLPTQSIVEAYQGGTSPARLASLYGCSQPTIVRILREAGVAIRSQSVAGVIRAAAEDPEAKRLRLLKMAEATRGVPLARETVELIAASKHRDLSQNMGLDEEDVFRALSEAGFDVLRQTPVGRYNLDFSVGQVAIEVQAGRHSPRLDRQKRHSRVDYLTDLGWRVLYLWCPDGLNAADLKEAVALVDRLRREPPTRGQYLVFRCEGNRPPRRGPKPQQGPRVVTTGGGDNA
ncbi:DUF559 domain-containing protein [Streptomyces sp900116325]|uniref:helix-turn-helix domain-containing protein n=1 Tax=Streptomyces sp. 900116325 TaxID=3154295 RepID=UPI0033F85D36